MAYLSHDARDGGDASYTAAGKRAAQFASGGLVKTLPQQRPGQRGSWEAWRDAGTLITTKVTAVKLPDGAPPANGSEALARVRYTQQTKSEHTAARRSEGQLAVSLSRSSGGSWRVTDLPRA